MTGLTRVSGIAFDQQGRLDILESSTAGGGDGTASAGALLRVARDAFLGDTPGPSSAKTPR